MTLRPLPAHAKRSHARLLDALVERTRLRFTPAADPTRPAAWDPEAATDGDAGRGLLDLFAAALHVLWVYQEAWADEGFLPSAVLEPSARRLLAHVGYAPPPGTTATGLQHFVIKEGLTATIPPGFRVRSAPSGSEPEAVYQTLSAVACDPWLEELRAFLPRVDGVDTTGAIRAALGAADPLSAFAVPGLVPPSGGAASAGDLLGQIEQRLAAARLESAAARRARRAAERARQLTEAVRALQDAGVPDACLADSALCDELCDAAAASVEPPEGLAGPLSESQETLAALLRSLAARQPQALDALGEVLRRGECETVEQWAARLDAMTGFLDALVAGMLQQARDQVARLHGPAALRRLDAAYGSRSDAAGIAEPGTTRLWLVRPTDPDGLPVSLADRIAPGTWLILGEDVPRTSPAGATTTTRRWREAVRVTSARDDAPVDGLVPPFAGLPATEITFQPPLRRRYRLSETVISGNNAVIAHGAPASVAWVGPPAGPVPLAGPLGFVLDTAAADGRRPLIEVTVDGVPWTRIDDLRFAGPTDRVYAVEPTPTGGHRLRFGDGRRGARIPAAAPVTATWSVGSGLVGNRAGQRVEELVDSHPAVTATTNRLPIAGGAEPEVQTLSALKSGIGISGLDRAVSEPDVRTLALGFAGIQDAVVRRDAVRRREAVEVTVAGDGGAALSDEGLELLRQHLQSRVPAGIRVRVANRVEVPIRLAIRLRLAPGTDPLRVIADARAALGLDGATTGLLHPARRRLGADVHVSEVYRWLDGIGGLVSSVVEALHRADRPPARADRVDVGATGIAVWAADDPVTLAWEEAQDR